MAILPGRGIGQIRLGDRESDVVGILGKPSYGDAAMGHFWDTWEKNGRVLDVYSQRGERWPLVRIVRVTSPAFRTGSGIGPGVTRTRALAVFPRVKRTARFTVSGERAATELWDDVRSGIAFEFQSGRCLAVSVHRPGEILDEKSASLVQYVRDRSSVRTNREDP